MIYVDFARGQLYAHTVTAEIPVSYRAIHAKFP